jgi:UDP-N-acetylglucosamine pyrophosphorylase
MCMQRSCHRYSEMSQEMAEARDQKTNKLKFCAANIAIHCFSLSFLQTCAARRNELPYVFFLRTCSLCV